MERLSGAEIERKLEGSRWQRQEDAIVREWRFGDFAEAMSFANRVAEAAEAAGHHPDMLIHGFSRVRLTVSTHSAGGLTAADFKLARTLEEIA